MPIVIQKLWSRSDVKKESVKGRHESVTKPTTTEVVAISEELTEAKTGTSHISRYIINRKQ
jgi:hypothetical protein